MANEPKKNSILGKSFLVIFFIAFLIVGFLVFSAWHELTKPASQASEPAQEHNNGEIEIWRPDGETSTGQPVYNIPVAPAPAPNANNEIPDADTGVSKMDNVPLNAGAAPKALNPSRTNNSLAPTAPAEGVPLTPINSNNAGTPVQPINTPAERPLQPITPPPAHNSNRSNSSNGSSKNPIDNLF